MKINTLLNTQKMYRIALLLVGCVYALWSWVLVDVNFTLVPHPYWTVFRGAVTTIGYHRREFSAGVFVSLVICATVVHLWGMRQKYIVSFRWVCAIGCVYALFSYNSLSHDFFNYLFDAKIVTYYHENPYLKKPMDFPTDQDLRFMHWTHRTYPYGPTFLVYSTILSSIGNDRFTLTWFVYRTAQLVLYCITFLIIRRKNTFLATIFATTPLVCIEGLANMHNDFVGVAFGLWSIVYSMRWLGVFSGGIKYITFPLVSRCRWIHIVGVLMLVLLVYMQLEPQSWYFLNIYVLALYIPWILYDTWPLSTALLLSYYPYVRGGEWGQGGDIGQKHMIMLFGILLQLWLCVWRGYETKRISWLHGRLSGLFSS